MKTIALGLVRGRHDMPVDGYVLDSVTNVSDISGIRLAVTKSLTEKLGDYIHIDNFGGCVNQANLSYSFFPLYIKRASDDDVCHYRCDVELHLYITGLTSVALAVVSFCAENGVPLVVHHYDRDTNTYIQQRVLW